MKRFSNKIEIQQRFHDHDMLGHVNSTVYFYYFELTRIDYFKKLFGNLESRKKFGGLANIVAHIEMDYISEVRLHDNIFGKVRTSKIGNKSFELIFELVKVVNNVEEKVSQGKAVMVCLDQKTRKTVALPEDWRLKMTEEKEQW
jgi:acyl-CoA thioester hydrolase